MRCPEPESISGMMEGDDNDDQGFDLGKYRINRADVPQAPGDQRQQPAAQSYVGRGRGPRTEAERCFTIWPCWMIDRMPVDPAWTLMTYLLHHSRITGCHAIPVSDVLARRLGICDRNKDRALAKLQHAGLITVQRIKGKSPIVHVPKV